MPDDWKSALRKLSRKPPSKQILQTIIDAMRSDASDQSTAILVAALVEVSLIGPIAQISGITQASFKTLFWDPNGLFSSFSRKVEGAALLRVIGPQTIDNLEVIRCVRNAFAHSLAEIHFTAPEITRACARLSLSANADFFVKREPKRQSRYCYCYACDTIFRGLLSYVALPLVTGNGPVAELPSRPILP